jgi:glutamyl-tRNA(Gln) amidotransferase subunit E
MASQPEISASDAVAAAGLTGLGKGDVESVIHNIVCSKSDLVKSKGDRSIGPLMGLVMQELRGKADGAVVSVILKKEIQNILQE